MSFTGATEEATASKPVNAVRGEVHGSLYCMECTAGSTSMRRSVIAEATLIFSRSGSLRSGKGFAGCSECEIVVRRSTITAGQARCMRTWRSRIDETSTSWTTLRKYRTRLLNCHRSSSGEERLCFTFSIALMTERTQPATMPCAIA